ncbi:sugar phosphate nucleotidyltransferase [Pelagibacteraceae bacterium]|nr:sugar phosphate nucleotidyltransferase [Pelagibacteraceae bacterium]
MNKNEIPIVILSGGLGTRIADNKKKLPKALVSINSKPILYHIIKYFKCYGYSKFVICLGYKGKMIKNYFEQNKNNKLFKNLDIKLVDTGIRSNTGLRIKKIEKYINKFFFLTYCDGLTNLDLDKFLKFFFRKDKSNNIGLVTAVNTQSRFGILKINKTNQLKEFNEKQIIENLWINGGYYFFNKNVFKFIKEKNPIFEQTTLPLLAKQNRLLSYKHKGFWYCMDTLKDRMELNKLSKKNPPWKIC